MVKYIYCSCTGKLKYDNNIVDNKYIHKCIECNKEYSLDFICGKDMESPTDNSRVCYEV